MALSTSQHPGSNASTATGEKPSLILYGGVAFVAFLKDLLDLIGLGSIPLIGTAVTLCFSFLIFMLLFLFDRSGGRGNKKVAQGMVMMLGTLIEGFGFVLNFLPLQTLTVVFLYIIAYRAWRQAKKAAETSKQGQTKEMRLQQVRLARAMARQEEGAVAVAAGTQLSARQVADQGAVSAIGQERADRAARITVRRGQVVSATPLVVPSRAPLDRPVVATRQPVVPRSMEPAANDATYRIRAAGSRMSQITSAVRNRPPVQTRPGPSTVSGGQVRRVA